MATNVQQMLTDAILKHGLAAGTDGATELTLHLLTELRRHDVVMVDGLWLEQLRANLAQTQKEREAGAQRTLAWRDAALSMQASVTIAAHQVAGHIEHARALERSR